MEIIGTSCVDPFRHLSHRYYTDFKQYGDNFLVDPRISYEALLKRMTVTFPANWLHTNTPVNVVRLNPTSGARVAVHSTDGNVHPADHVIVTVPLGVLKTDTDLFDPPLPPVKRDAISKAGFGNVAKIFIHFSAPTWDSIRVNDSRPLGLLWTNGYLGIPYDPPASLTVRSSVNV